MERGNGKSKNKKSAPTILKRFGGVLKMSLPKGGTVEMLLCGNEISRLMDAFIEIEQSKKNPNDKIIDACKVVGKAAFAQDGIRIKVESVIANHECELVVEHTWENTKATDLNIDRKIV